MAQRPRKLPVARGAGRRGAPSERPAADSPAAALLARVLIVGADPGGLVAALAEHGITARAVSPAAVAAMIAGLIVVPDGPDLPAVAGAITDLRRRGAAAALLALRTDHDADPSPLFEIADGVLHDGAPPALVATQLRALARLIATEPPTANPEVVSVRGITIDLDRREVRVGGRPLALTPTEFRILSLLARKRGVANHGELFREIHAYDVSDQEAKDILKVHIWRLRAKLAEVVPDSNLIVNVRGFGYLLERRARDRAARGAEDRPA